jgi:hypothetical protein
MLRHLKGEFKLCKIIAGCKRGAPGGCGAGLSPWKRVGDMGKGRRKVCKVESLRILEWLQGTQLHLSLCV